MDRQESQLQGQGLGQQRPKRRLAVSQAYAALLGAGALRSCRLYEVGDPVQLWRDRTGC